MDPDMVIMTENELNTLAELRHFEAHGRLGLIYWSQEKDGWAAVLLPERVALRGYPTPEAAARAAWAWAAAHPE